MSPPRVGLTGGIGSGKSTVASMFAALGIAVLDLDRVGHDVVAPNSEGLARLVHAFGDDILSATGALDRKKLAQRCFCSDAQVAKLNAIMHPLIWQAEEAWLRRQRSDYVVIEASVLLESGGVSRMDAVVVVLADEEIRRQRVLARGDRSAAEFDAVVARQCSDADRRQAADFTILNSGTLAQLHQQVLQTDAMLREYLPR